MTTSAKRDKAANEVDPLILNFDDNGLLPSLFGEHDRHLARIEQKLGVSLHSRGNRVAVSGPPESCSITSTVLRDLYKRLESGMDVGEGEVDAAIRMANADPGGGAAGGKGNHSVSDAALQLKTFGRSVTPRSPMQAEYVARIFDHELVFGLGPAGTGKTYLAVAAAVSMLREGQVDRLVLSRPAVEAGERLGFLPGDMRDKVDPYLRPLYDALNEMLPGGQLMRRMESGDIEVAPLAFMRGRTLTNSFVILDEAQNTTPVQMKMFLTRLGENSRMVVTGDPSQVDLPPGITSGVADARATLKKVKGVCFVRFSDADVVRHPLVTRVVRAYNERDARRSEESTNGGSK